MYNKEIESIVGSTNNKFDRHGELFDEQLKILLPLL
jgi:hypothetical protein